MNEDIFEIELYGKVIAKDLSMEHALIFAKGLFNEYYNEYFKVTINKIAQDCEMCDSEV